MDREASSGQWHSLPRRAHLAVLPAEPAIGGREPLLQLHRRAPAKQASSFRWIQERVLLLALPCRRKLDRYRPTCHLEERLRQALDRRPGTGSDLNARAPTRSGLSAA